MSKASNRSLDCYKEHHHIIPKALGGSDSLDNLVYLTAREHYIAHLLLTRITEGIYKSKMVNAVFCMINLNNTKVSSKIYEKLRIAQSERMKIYNPVFNNKTKEKISNSLKKFYSNRDSTFKGKHHSEATKKILSEQKKDKPLSHEHRKKISEAHKGKTGFKHSEATKQRIASKLKLLNTGKKHTLKSKQKMSESAKLRWLKYKNENSINPAYSAPN